MEDGDHFTAVCPTLITVFVFLWSWSARTIRPAIVTRRLYLTHLSGIEHFQQCKTKHGWVMELFWAEGGDVNNLPPVQLACSYLRRVVPVQDALLVYRQLCSVQPRPLGSASLNILFVCRPPSLLLLSLASLTKKPPAAPVKHARRRFYATITSLAALSRTSPPPHQPPPPSSSPINKHQLITS